MARSSERPRVVPGWAWPAAIALLALWRLAYHAAYMQQVPFAEYPVSDGQLYVRAAADILTHPPLGRELIYLQPAYVYFVAGAAWLGHSAMAVGALQIAISAMSTMLLWDAVQRIWGRHAGWATVAIYLCAAPVAFYDNKVLTGSLAAASMIWVVHAAVLWSSGSSVRRSAWLGIACGAAALIRPNMVLLAPVVSWVMWRFGDRAKRPLHTSVALGCALALALPLAARNLSVADQFTVWPAHGGGPVFFTGNNPHSRGVYNRAGGLLSGQIDRESTELADKLGVHADSASERAEAVGDALYARAWGTIMNDPLRYAGLWVKKLWLTLGSDELSQDYDVRGERELLGRVLGAGIPFAWVLAAAIVGLRLRWRSAGPWRWIWAGACAAVLAANVAYFTSAQHRLPLWPLLVPWAAWSLLKIRAWNWRHGVLAVAVVVAGAVPRLRDAEPSPVHYFNLAIAYDRVGLPEPAKVAMRRALEEAPAHPVIQAQGREMLDRLERDR